MPPGVLVMASLLPFLVSCAGVAPPQKAIAVVGAAGLSSDAMAGRMMRREGKDAGGSGGEVAEDAEDEEANELDDESKPASGEQDEANAEPNSETSHTPFYNVLIMILTSPSETEHRDAIRNSYGMDLNSQGFCSRCDSTHTVKYLFVVAETDATAVEAKKRDDMLLLPHHEENFRSLSGKVRRAFCLAAHRYRFDMLLKVDTDSYVFTDVLLSWAEQHELFKHPAPRVYAGYVHEDVTPTFNKDNKYYDTEYTKLTGRKTFPQYMEGCGYLLTRDLVEHVASKHSSRCTSSELPDFANEDVSVGFWIENQSYMALGMPVEPWQDCRQDGSVVVDHHVPPVVMLQRRKNLMSFGHPCRTSPPTTPNPLGVFAKPVGWLQALRALVLGY